jgi:hypothetical protein
LRPFAPLFSPQLCLQHWSSCLELSDMKEGHVLIFESKAFPKCYFVLIFVNGKLTFDDFLEQHEVGQLLNGN